MGLRVPFFKACSQSFIERSLFSACLPLFYRTHAPNKLPIVSRYLPDAQPNLSRAYKPCKSSAMRAVTG
jgi:hypothetical protein